MHANLFRQRGKDKKFCAARGPGTFIKVRRGWLAQNLGVEFLNFTQPLPLPIPLPLPLPLPILDLRQAPMSFPSGQKVSE